jgi:hypothetical protein
MQETLKVVATRDGGPGKPAALGTIPRDGFSWSGNDAILRTAAGRQLEQLIQIGGSVDRSFHLVDGGMMFVECSIVGRGGPGNLYRLMFLRTAPAP